jgi:hypothetical protein
MPLISHSSAISCRAFHRFNFTHSTPALISTGMGKTWPLHPSLHGASVCQSLAILTFGIPTSPSPSHLPATWPQQVWPLAMWVRDIYLLLQVHLVFSLGDALENFLNYLGNTHSNIPSDSPLGCLLYNLTKLGLKGDLKPKTSSVFYGNLPTIQIS